jgi:hypothetical protein
MSRVSPSSARRLPSSPGDLDVATEFLFELRLAAPLGSQQRRVAIARELAVHLQFRQRLDLAGDVHVADAIAHRVHVLDQDLAVDEFVDEFRLLRLDHFRRQLVAGGLLELGQALLPGAAHLLHRDAFAVHLGGSRRRPRLESDSPEDEYHGNGAEEYPGEPA